MPVKLSPMVQPSSSAIVWQGGRLLVASVKGLVLLVGLAALPIDGFAYASEAGQVTSAAKASPNSTSSAKDFLGDLETHLNTMQGRGLMSPAVAKEIHDDFHRYTARFPRLYDQPDFVHAIPTARTLGPETPEVEGIKPRRLPEILGANTIRSEDVGEMFRRMFASKKEDGTNYDMFVREYYAALASRGSFRKADGALDEKAIAASLKRTRDWFPIWSKNLDEMKRDGSLERFANAINSMVVFSEKQGLNFQPWQARDAIANLAVCVSAMADTPPESYVESCSGLMLQSDKLRLNAVEIIFHDSHAGKHERKRALSKWWVFRSIVTSDSGLS